jgi:hypothetical protein
LNINVIHTLILWKSHPTLIVSSQPRLTHNLDLTSIFNHPPTTMHQNLTWLPYDMPHIIWIITKTRIKTRRMREIPRHLIVCNQGIRLSNLISFLFRHYCHVEHFKLRNASPSSSLEDNILSQNNQRKKNKYSREFSWLKQHCNPFEYISVGRNIVLDM